MFGAHVTSCDMERSAKKMPWQVMPVLLLLFADIGGLDC